MYIYVYIYIDTYAVLDFTFVSHSLFFIKNWCPIFFNFFKNNAKNVVANV